MRVYEIVDTAFNQEAADYIGNFDGDALAEDADEVIWRVSCLNKSP